MMLLPGKKQRALLSSEVDLEMLAPELLARRHTSLFGEHSEASPKKPKTRILRFDVTGQSSMIDLKRSEVLKLTHLAAELQNHREISATAPPVNPVVHHASPRKSKVHPPSATNYHAIQTVHTRDLRKLDATFRSSNDPCITVRKQAVLINADPIRAIIMRDTCLVFMPDQSDEFLPIMKTKLQELIAESEGTSFEFRVLEAILYTLCKLFFTECVKTFPQITSALERLAKAQISTGELETLRSLKNTINEFNSQVEGIRRVLMELLDNDNDLRLLYLTHLFEDPDLLSRSTMFDPEEAEVLLESYLQEIHTIRTKIRLLQDRIQNTESLVMLKLDSTRNHLLTVDVLFSLLTVSFTFGMFVTAAFGMNLRSGMEDHASAFSYVLISSCVICVLIVIAGLAYFRKKGVLVW